MAAPEQLFFEAAKTALSLIRSALGGNTDALKKLKPILPNRLQTSIARAAAEARAKKRLRKRR